MKNYLNSHNCHQSLIEKIKYLLLEQNDEGLTEPPKFFVNFERKKNIHQVSALK
jgi:hypothetical protein